MAAIQGNGLSVLSFDGAQLAFPLGQINGVQRISQLEAMSQLPRTLGSLVHGGRHWPVFGLNNHFRLADKLSSRRMQCVCLSADEAETGLALVCDNVITVALDADVSVPLLPPCMHRERSPISHWFKLDDRVVTVSSAPALAHYIMGLMEENDG